MYKKRFSAICFLLVFVLAGSVSAQSADWWWVGGFDGNSWNEPNNWLDPDSQASVPISTSQAYPLVKYI